MDDFEGAARPYVDGPTWSAWGGRAPISESASRRLTLEEEAVTPSPGCRSMIACGRCVKLPRMRLHAAGTGGTFVCGVTSGSGSFEPLLRRASVLRRSPRACHISGCHLNPAVTLGLVAGGRHSAKEALPYIAVQT